jgi:proteasome lid subunit RPN8/RPN11
MIQISPELLHKIKIHGEKSYNEECCGALLGKFNDTEFTIYDLIEFINEKEENREKRFLISPAQYRSAEITAMQKNMELLGFYHSHPDHPAVPSQFDTDHALPWFIYIIVAVNKGKAGNLSAWILKEDRSGFQEQEVTIRDDEKEPLNSRISFDL